MISAAVERTPRPTASRPRVRTGSARPTGTKAPASTVGNSAKAAVAADVMAVLAAFGIED